MLSTTLKRTAATLGVVAGLLAAAGPASAQILDGPVLAKATPKPSVVIDLNDPFFRVVGGIVPGGAIISAHESRSGVDKTMPLLWQGDLVDLADDRPLEGVSLLLGPAAGDHSPMTAAEFDAKSAKEGLYFARGRRPAAVQDAEGIANGSPGAHRARP
jgi:hypothetical protein